MLICNGLPWNSTFFPRSNLVSFSLSPKVTLVIFKVFSSKMISFPFEMLSIVHEAFPDIVWVSKSTLMSRSRCFATALLGWAKE